MKLLKKLLLLVCVIPISSMLGMDEESFTTKTLSDLLGTNFIIKTKKEYPNITNTVNNLNVETHYNTQHEITKRILYLNPLVKYIAKNENLQLTEKINELTKINEQQYTNLEDYKKLNISLNVPNSTLSEELVSYKTRNSTLTIDNSKLQKKINFTWKYIIPIFGIGGLLVGCILTANLCSMYYNPNPQIKA